MGTDAQVYQVLIKASPQQVWDAITRPEFTRRFWFGSSVTMEPVAGTPYRSYAPDGTTLWVDALVEEADPPRRLVHGWRALYSPELADEPVSRITWEIAEQEPGVCLLTVVHDRLEDSPRTAEGVGGLGWLTVLHGLKTLLETGAPLFAH